MTHRPVLSLAHRFPWLVLAAAALLGAPGGRAYAEDAAPGGEAKPDTPKPDAPKPDAPKPDEPKPDAPKPDAPKPDGAAPAAEAVTLTAGRTELMHLEEYLKKSKSDNQDILAAMDEVLKAYKHLAPDDEAGKATFEADREKFHKETEGLFVRALGLVKVRPNSKSNERDDVNVKAAQLLAQTNKRVTREIITTLDQKIFKAKGYEPATAVYDESFKAIALLNDHRDGFGYVTDWLKYDSTPGVNDRVKAAFDAVILFQDVKGKDRFGVVEKITRTFVGVEAAANRGRTKDEQAQKRVWDKIKPSVIKCLQVYAKEPKAPDGALIATVDAFTQWLRDHDSPRDPAWVDPKIVGEQK